MFRIPRKTQKEKEMIEKPVAKCSFCKKNSVGKFGDFYYCSDNACAIKLHKKRN